MPPYLIDAFAKALRNIASDAELLSQRLESSSTRVMSLDISYKELQGLALLQDESFRQALHCAELGMYRAAIILGWIGFVDYLQQWIADDDFEKLGQVRDAWQVKSLQVLREKATESALIKALSAASFISSHEEKAFLALLTRRNMCAHPGDFYPGLNETLGFISEIFQWIRLLQLRRDNI